MYIFQAIDKDNDGELNLEEFMESYARYNFNCKTSE